jgi:DHA2 family multidrug resistance protein
MAKNLLRLPFNSLGRPTHHPIFAVCAVLLGPFIVGFHSRLFGVGLPDLRGAFGLSVDESAWLNTLSTAPQILLAPGVAWLAAVFGVRRVLIGPALLYAAVSLAIPFARDFSLLAALHLIHGCLLGVFIPATLMIIFRNLPIRWWVTAIGIYAFRSAFTTNSGTSLLDFYVQDLGWQYVYWQDVALAPCLALLAYLGAPAEPINKTLLSRSDWGGMLLLGSGLAMIFVAIDQGNRLDWVQNGLVTSFLVGGVAVLIAFFINEIVAKHPWASASVLWSKNVALLLVVVLLYLLTSLSNTTLVPNFLSTVALLRPEQTGALLLEWCCIPLLICTPLAVWALHRIDGRYIVLIGLTCFATAALLGTGLTSEWNEQSFRTIAVLQGAGHILSFLPLIVMVVANGDPKQATALAAYIQVIRLLGNETAQALMTTFLRKREQVHSFYVGLNVEKGTGVVTTLLNSYTKKFTPMGEASAQSRGVAILNQHIQTQANVLSFIDGFWLTFVAAILGLIILVFATRAPDGPLTAVGRRRVLTKAAI